ncbi:hypothetical protein BKA66DRAFT_479914 [Pyrenochaeta sp. MPI-SDFR-AT-0127]|nr:hypothetical protein BKA66DRAFT_479914 [Pyrenochaeta sp. MPI-SDFR-AT-0127]
MEDPAREIPAVIHLLTQSSPSVQRETIERYFTPNASFTHPFCRTGSWQISPWLNSRWVVEMIYRWYKIMSPRIELTVQSVAFDKPNAILYVQIFQIFRIWLVPYYYAPVKLTSVLTLCHDPCNHLYYIESQHDLYQVDQFVKFLVPGAWVLVWLWQFWASFFCVIGAILGSPMSWVEENWGWGNQIGEEEVQVNQKKWTVLDGRSDTEVLRGSELRGRIIG